MLKGQRPSLVAAAKTTVATVSASKNGGECSKQEKYPELLTVCLPSRSDLELRFRISLLHGRHSVLYATAMC